MQFNIVQRSAADYAPDEPEATPRRVYLRS
jgi:hypothetical protein